MTPIALTPLTPLLVLSGVIVLVMLMVSFRRSHGVTATATVVGLVGTMASISATCSSGDSRQVTSLLVMDDFALLVFTAILASSIAVAMLAHSYFERRRENPEEFYILLLLATLGAGVMAGATHFASLFLGLETLSVALYGMIGYARSSRLSIEAAIKYLVLAGASSAFLLFGMALLYAESGTMAFGDLGALLTSGAGGGALVAAGLGLMMVGAGFKLAVAPFHFWTPDVYEGAPAPVTAFVATVSKGGMVAVLLRFFLEVGMPRQSSVFFVISAIAAASMLVGNLLALMQTNVKRILAYSSIAHLGYLLVAFLAGCASGSEMAIEAVAFYLIAYMATSLASFGVVSVMSESHRDADSLEDYRGLYWRKPWLAGVMTVSLLSLAGIPLTAGFVAKFYVLSAGLEVGLYALVGLLVLNSAIGIYYYLRIVLAMLWTPEHVHAASTEPAFSQGAVDDPPHAHATTYGAGALAAAPWVPFAAALVLVALTLALIWVGVQPGPLQSSIEAAVTGLK